MSLGIRSLSNHIVVGTLLSAPAIDSCGLTNTVVTLSPPINPLLPVTFAVTNMQYNGGANIPVAGTYTDILLLMNAAMGALGVSTGLAWHYFQLSEFEFLICTIHTQNGDILVIDVSVTQTVLLGNLDMDVTLSGGVAPVTPTVFQLDNQCLKQAVAVNILGKLNSLCSCEDESESVEEEFIELKEDNFLEIREN